MVNVTATSNIRNICINFAFILIPSLGLSLTLFSLLFI